MLLHDKRIEMVITHPIKISLILLLSTMHLIFYSQQYFWPTTYWSIRTRFNCIMQVKNGLPVVKLFHRSNGRWQIVLAFSLCTNYIYETWWTMERTPYFFCSRYSYIYHHRQDFSSWPFFWTCTSWYAHMVKRIYLVYDSKRMQTCN